MSDNVDRSNMAEVIRQTPEQFQVGLDAAGDVDLPERRFTSLLVIGMGGSWMPAALIADAALARVPIYVHRSYGLPGGVDLDHALVVAYSFSGNTEEVLSAFDEACDRKLPVVGVAKGGDLQKRCREAPGGAPFIRIPADPPDMQPRSATGYGVGILVALLDRLHVAAVAAAEQLVRLGQSLAEFMAEARERGRRIAENLHDATPVIYTTNRYATVAGICKIKFNENAKVPAFWNVLPELNHNEMVGWTQPRGAYHCLFLSDPDAHPRVRRRETLTREVLRERGLESSLVPMRGRGVLERMFSTLLVADWASYELAVALGVDPTPVEMVEEFKKRLGD